MSSNKAKGVGYRLERVYVADQEYQLVEAGEAHEAADTEDRDIRFGWDWRPIGERKFQVIIDIEINPIKLAPERARVRLVGVFEALSADDSALPFVFFVKQNAPAILFPYAREIVSAMTGRGLYGSFHLNPINIVSLLAEVPLEGTTGARFLDENPDEAIQFGLEYRTTPVAQ